VKLGALGGSGINESFIHVLNQREEEFDRREGAFPLLCSKATGSSRRSGEKTLRQRSIREKEIVAGKKKGGENGSAPSTCRSLPVAAR